MNTTQQGFPGLAAIAASNTRIESSLARPGAAAAWDTRADVRASARWEPGKTWVFAVCVLTYPSGKAWPERRPTRRRNDPACEACGVPPGQITFIKDRNATIAAVRGSFEAVMAEVPADATLWFYFAGHGTKSETGVSEFELYDGPWPVPDVFSTIERRFPGTTALLFADCCYSGSLGMEAMLRAGRVNYGTLTSSLASEDFDRHLDVHGNV